MTAIFRQILFWLPFVLLLLLISLSFYQHPVADDFSGSYFTYKLGIAGTIQSYLTNGTGRYFVIAVFAMVCSSRFLLDHYFIIPVLFFVCTYANLFYLFRTIWLIFFDTKLILRRLHWLTGSCMLLFLTSADEVSTFFIWITTCCIFLLSFNLLVCYTHCLLLFKLRRESVSGKWMYAVLFIMNLLLAGCEETTLYFSLLLNLFFCFTATGKRRLNRFSVFLVLSQLFCLVIVFFIPGNRMRTHNFAASQPFYFSLISAFYQTVFIFFKIVSNPLFWFFAGGCLMVFPLLKNSWQEKFKVERRSYIVYISAVAGAMFFFFFFIRQFGGRVVPQYANNLIICYTIMILLMLAISKSFLFSAFASQVANVFRRVGTIVYLSFICLFIFSDFTNGLIQSIITGPIHNKVLNDRQAKIEAVKSAGKTAVSFGNYQDECIEVMNDKYGKRIASFVRQQFQFPPKYIYTHSNTPADLSYAAYYRIDTIYTGKKYVVSWEKAGLPLWNVK